MKEHAAPCIAYRCAFYFLAAAPVWGAALTVILVLRHTHLS